MMIIAIQNNLGQLWDRKDKTWINPEDYSAFALDRRCAYPTYRGCNQVAYRLHKKTALNVTQWPKHWGNLRIRSKGE